MGYLKEIAALCGINKDVTFHVARHTFATTVTLENGVPVESVSKMLGHTNIQTTQIYARITERKINQDMDVLSKKLDPQTGVYKMPESEYRARKARKLRQELQEFALSNGVTVRSYFSSLWPEKRLTKRKRPSVWMAVSREILIFVVR